MFEGLGRSVVLITYLLTARRENGKIENYSYASYILVRSRVTK